MNVFKLIFALIVSIFAQPKQAPKREEGESTYNRMELPKRNEVSAVRIVKPLDDEYQDAISIARDYVPKSERIRRIVVKHEEREILNMRGKQIDVENLSSIFRVIAKTIMDDEIVLHIAQT